MNTTSFRLVDASHFPMRELTSCASSFSSNTCLQDKQRKMDAHAFSQRTKRGAHLYRVCWSSEFLDKDTFDWPRPLAVIVMSLATSAPPRGRAVRSCAKAYLQSLPRARWVRMSRGWGLGAGEGGGPNPKLAYDVRQSSHFTGSPLSAIRALGRHGQGRAMRGWSGG